MGRRHRQREKLAAPTTDYPDPEGNVLALRGSLSPASRREYDDLLRGGLHQEDAAARALEFLFERLAVAWTIAGVRTDRQRELLDRFRIATAAERSAVRAAIRRHVEANFPELAAP